MESQWLPGPVGEMLRSSGLATTTTIPVGKLVTTTTHVGLDLENGRLIKGTPEDEFTAIFVCLDAALRNAGVRGGVADAHKITAYLISPADEPILLRIFRERYPGRSPAWGTVIVPAIVVPDTRAELQAEAILEREVGSSQARLLRRELARPASQLLAALLKWTAFQFVESAEPPPAGS
ncbi:Endoribonuclease L-PSP family protein [Fusarium acuminatum]|uniref:Endoribonuclease L-PSP family protein n=1 Tax=Fusarium acuminatum TaxID=5515 RepID=A0ABZ2WFZ7_9HYPO